MTTWRHLLILALFSAAGAAYGQRVYPVDLDLRKQQHPFTVEAAGRTSVRIEARILNNGGAYLSASNWTGTFFFAPSSTSAVGTAISAASPSGHVFTVDIPQQYTSATGTYFAQFIFAYPGMTQEWSRGTFRLLASAGTGEYGDMAWNSTNNALRGDVTGIYSNNRVSSIGGVSAPTNEPTTGDAIVYDGSKLVYQSAGASGVELSGDVTGPATNTTVGKLLGWPILTNAISAYYIPFWVGGNIEFRNPYLYWPSSNAFDVATNTLAGQVARYPVTAGAPTTGDFLRWSAGYWDHIDASIYFLARNGGTTTNLTVDGTLAVVTNLTIGSTPLPWLQLSTDGSTSYMQGQNGAMEVRDNSGIAALRLTSDRERVLYDGNGSRIAQVGYFNGVGHESTLWLYRPLYAPTATIASLTGTVIRAATSGGLQLQSMSGSTCAVFGAGSGCNVSFGDGATFQGTVSAPTVTVVNAYATRTNLPTDPQELLTYGDYLDLVPAGTITGVEIAGGTSSTSETGVVTLTPGASGGGGSVSNEVWQWWADSVPRSFTNSPNTRPYTNTQFGFAQPFLEFSKDSIQPIGPDARWLPVNATSNVTTRWAFYTAGNTNLTARFALAWTDGQTAATNYSGPVTLGVGGLGAAAATPQTFAWATTLSNCVPGRPVLLWAWCCPTNSVAGVTTRDADLRVRDVRVEVGVK